MTFLFLFRISVSNVEECISKGMLQAQDEYYAFRHELARQTILESISPQRKITLHRMALSALKDSSETRNDLARLANHAEGTKDANLIFEYVPAAAQQASTASSHREAIALYEVALRFADKLSPDEHAKIMEAYALEFSFKYQIIQQIAILQKTIELWRSIGNPLREGQNLARLAERALWAWQSTESEKASQAAITILEALPPGIELAQAYKTRCLLRTESRDCAEAVMWGEKALSLAERFGDTDTLARAYTYSGFAMMVMDYERGRALMDKSLTIAREANHVFALAGTFGNLAWALVEVYQIEEANLCLADGIAYAVEHDDDYHLGGRCV